MIEDAQALLHYMEALHVVVHIEYASIALLFYDYLLTIGREIRFVWDRTPWSLGRALFFITRYMPFIGTFLTLHVDMIRSASLPSCARWTQAAVYFNVADIVIAEIILTLRVMAIWARNRKVAISLVVIFIGLVLVAVVTVARVQVGQNPFGEALYGAYGVCPPYFAGSNALSVAYMVLVAYETVLLILTLIKAIGHWREPGSSSFINVFFADGLSYNCFILASSTANIIIRYQAPSDYINLLAPLQPVLHSILTGRMMLHLRQDAVLAGHLDTSHTRTGLDFAPTPQAGSSLIQTSGVEFTEAISFEIGTLTDVDLSDSETRVDHRPHHSRSWFGER
ncbi:hypothetical protein Moror_15192 [Moniliophthora roreri MCA 2997]|uniref:DUF6533 domain-containing protein n=1 Tax=Moniliophthora roreri (strain MCA 2997) TaxID=1381753 RepID=V2WIT5_MONRO|nr:hypothetical protein Moror_15192 [Moniliophthora roreri MCA 2997]